MEQYKIICPNTAKEKLPRDVCQVKTVVGYHELDESDDEFAEAAGEQQRALVVVEGDQELGAVAGVPGPISAQCWRSCGQSQLTWPPAAPPRAGTRPGG